MIGAGLDFDSSELLLALEQNDKAAPQPNRNSPRSPSILDGFACRKKQSTMLEKLIRFDAFEIYFNE